jgi:uncharacterized protein (TIGR02246 family)
VKAIDRLLAIEEIKKVKARYFRFIDTKDNEGFLNQFTDDLHWLLLDVEGNTVNEFRGRDELRAFLQGLAEARVTGFSAHHGHTPEIEIIDDHNATGIWAMSDYIRMPGMNMIGYGHYHERYRKGDDGVWRIRSSRVERLHIDELEATVPPFSGEKEQGDETGGSLIGGGAERSR